MMRMTTTFWATLLLASVFLGTVLAPRAESGTKGPADKPAQPADQVSDPAGSVDSTAGAAKAKPSRWAKDIARFEEMDKKSPPPSDPILFVGSSSIRRWNLDQWFPGMPVINRGFGGSQTSDVLEFADRIILPYKPKVIVFYSGENDIASGKKSPEVVAADMQKLIDYVKTNLPETKLIMISVKPSVKRQKLLDQIVAIGKKQREMAAEHGVEFVDVYSEMVDATGAPRPDIFVKDNLHMNDAGYAIWVEKLNPLLGKPSQGDASREEASKGQ